ncbi:hotdog domain-containing protein [Loigolactobacillus zhaoyuanensis]|uniref:Hotdog domain-containing protein n=1 Tax=Loigolactobacillus zhaoyuanensis TaxID=2486017 RepID=A0ABW8UFD2_9LACO
MTKSCRASLVQQQYRVRYQDLNSHQTLHGGHLLHLVDDQVAESAHRFGQQKVVTASIDRFDFIRPLTYGTSFTIYSFVSGATQRALEVYVYVLTTAHQLVAEAFVTLISLTQQPDWPQPQPESRLEKIICAEYAQRYAANLTLRNQVAIRRTLL